MKQPQPLSARIGTKIGKHMFLATAITAYLKNGGTLDKAAVMANHASTKTTQLYDCRCDWTASGLEDKSQPDAAAVSNPSGLTPPRWL